jgi:hypothetical protein
MVKRRLNAMAEKRKIKGKDVISDIRSGLTDSQLMDKYELSPMGLQKVFRKLVDAGALSIKEIYARNPLREDSVVIDLEDISFAPDSPLECIIPICDATNPECRGAVCEIGENGLQVSGINATPGEQRSFLIDARDFFAVDEFRFQAKCLWCKESSLDQSSSVGWEITGILAEDLENLRELVRRIKVQG